MADVVPGVTTEPEVEAAITLAIEAVPGWKPSKRTQDTLALESKARAHKAFVVETRSTVRSRARSRDKQQAAHPTAMDSTVVVSISYRLRAADQQEERRLAMAEEVLVRKAVLGTATVASLTFESSQRRVQEGWALADLTFIAKHLIDLS